MRGVVLQRTVEKVTSPFDTALQISQGNTRSFKYRSNDIKKDVSPKSPSSEEFVVPHIIHQSWKSEKAVPTRFRTWMKSWPAKHPKWKYMFWNDDNNLEIFRVRFPKYYSVATAISKTGLADMSRYALLHEYGGVYADADFECLKPLDDIILDYPLVLSSEPYAHTVLLEGSTKIALCNAIMTSIPKHPFWIKLLDNIKEKFENALRIGSAIDPVSITGPRILQFTFDEYLQTNIKREEKVIVLPEEYFYPEIAYWNIDSFNRACGRRNDDLARSVCLKMMKNPKGIYTKNTHAVHHWQCTWCRGDNTKSYSSLFQMMKGFQIFTPVLTKEGAAMQLAYD